MTSIAEPNSPKGAIALTFKCETFLDDGTMAGPAHWVTPDGYVPAFGDSWTDLWTAREVAHAAGVPLEER